MKQRSLKDYAVIVQLAEAIKSLRYALRAQQREIDYLRVRIEKLEKW